MRKKSCLVGQKYDPLLRMCIRGKGREMASHKGHPKAEPQNPPTQSRLIAGHIHQDQPSQKLNSEPVPKAQNQLIVKTMTTKASPGHDHQDQPFQKLTSELVPKTTQNQMFLFPSERLPPTQNQLVAKTVTTKASPGHIHQDQSFQKQPVPTTRSQLIAKTMTTKASPGHDHQDQPFQKLTSEPAPKTTQNQLIAKTLTTKASPSHDHRDQPFQKLNSEPVPMTGGQLIEKTMLPKASPVLPSSALWACLVLAVMGSILSLALWCVIIRRQSRSSNSEEAVPERKPVQKTEPSVQLHLLSSERSGQAETFQRAADIPSPCHQLLSGANVGLNLEHRFADCRDPIRYGGKEGGGGLPACSNMGDHRIPLPATELGSTLLVTTKTV